MKQLGSLFNDFYKRDLKYVQYTDSKNRFPSLTIKKTFYATRPWNPFAIRISFTDKIDIYDNFSFLVYKTGKSQDFYWTTLSSRGIFLDPVGPFPTWEETFDSLEIHCMEYFDTDEPIVWDMIVEI